MLNDAEQFSDQGYFDVMIIFIYLLKIKAAEIIDSERFRCGFTLRFPRVEKFRDDKEWYDCMTLSEVTELKQVGFFMSFYYYLNLIN